MILILYVAKGVVQLYKEWLGEVFIAVLYRE